MKKEIIKLAPVLAVAFMFTACSRSPQDPGRVYMPDMTYSNAYETYSASDITTPVGSEVFGMSARLPVKNTIPRGYIPDDDRIKTNEAFLLSYMAKDHFTHDPANYAAEYKEAGEKIQDPLIPSDENMAEGKRLYEINCKVCHGEKGEGNGQIVELADGSDGPFTSRPPKYADRLKQITDGQIFYSVSYGRNMMGGYGYQLSVKERWQVIGYIKSLAGIKPGDAPVTASADSTAGAAKKSK